ncbi:PTS fructose transporter subunit IIABC [Helicobacter cholecystus]|uniref:PTS fructose transporter subunit IIABC n=1 Tax=Helicobacter cholecystus TaxID=45498 RepID=UPI00273892B8|nr:fructose-specific PTS transporter subunit EIIC [Helicobacter cholecystus]
MKKITDLLALECISLNAKANSKSEVIAQAVKLMDKSGNLLDMQAYKEAVLKREEEGSTGIGEGIAIPHAKSSSVKNASLVAMIFPEGVEFDSLDGQSVKLLFMIAAPEDKNEAHLEILSQLSELLMQNDFVEKLLKAQSAQEFCSIIDEAQGVQKNQRKQTQNAKVLAVTACPTGIAHTYMAAQSLEKKAQEMGVEIKVETRGSSGVKNELSAEDIEYADCIIIAADTQVPLERFKGKRVLFVKVAQGISEPQELINRAYQASIYQGSQDFQDFQDQKKTKISTGYLLYKHLMNGVSYMLPFVVGGGIFIALAFLIDGYYVDLLNASDGVKKAFGSNSALAKFFMDIGGVVFSFMLPILAGFIAMSIADRPALVVGFIGGAIAKLGTSGFLGAILAGFLAGYIVLGLKKALSFLPHSLDGMKPILFYPLLGILSIALIMTYIVEPPIGAINTFMNEGLNSMNGEWKVLLGILLGVMMAADLGGPINKAAYVFGAASIASGNYDIMAAVMIGGMVPPLTIALATTLFKKKFTPTEQKGGISNYIMGLSFITEGAIPYAASDPLRVLGSCMIGSGISGGLSMYFSCSLMAPHGGIFVFPVVGNVLGYCFALAIGSMIGAIILGIWKKEIK